VLLKCGYDGAKADIWSCGVILFVLMAGYLPFNDTNLVLLYRKIAQSNYRCPPWFSIDARKLLARLLDPNPRTRITMSKLKAHPWLQKGPCPLTDKHLVTSETTSVLLGNKEACKCHHHRDEEDEEDARERKRSKVTVSSPTIAVRPSSMNAFDIISRSIGLDLSKMFDEEHGAEARFTSRESTAAIVSKLEEIAESRKLSVKLKEKGRVEMEGSLDGGRGALAIEAEIFEVAPSVHVVEMRKTGGDSLEFREFYRQDLKPSLGDIVWSWQGGNSPPPAIVPAVPRARR
jgi:5'-AMP-activated protein kinase catalytic alpha subunit